MSAFIDVPSSLLKKAGVKNPKPVVYGTIIVIGGIILFVVVSKVIKFIQGGGTTEAKTQEDMQDELKNIPTYGATLSEGNAIIIAQNLLNAMDRFGTDENAIIDNLSRARNTADLNLIIKTFGIKPKASFGLSDTFLENHFESVMKNLNGWLRDELSGSDLKTVKLIYDNLGVPF